MVFLAAQRMFDQQVALLRIQAELGEKAARVNREKQAVVRKRDRAIASVPNYKEGEDVEEFLLTAEKRLGVGGIREDDWVVILASKLSGKLGTVWQDICATVEAVADLEILSWGDQILIYFLIVVVLCYYYLGVELTEKSTATGTEKNSGIVTSGITPK